MEMLPIAPETVTSGPTPKASSGAGGEKDFSSFMQGAAESSVKPDSDTPKKVLKAETKAQAKSKPEPQSQSSNDSESAEKPAAPEDVSAGTQQVAACMSAKDAMSTVPLQDVDNSSSLSEAKTGLMPEGELPVSSIAKTADITIDANAALKNTVQQKMPGTSAANQLRSDALALADFAAAKNDGMAFSAAQADAFMKNADPRLVELMQAQNAEIVSLSVAKGEAVSDVMDPRFAQLLGGQAALMQKAAPEVNLQRPWAAAAEGVVSNSLESGNSPVAQIAEQLMAGGGDKGAGSDLFQSEMESFGKSFFANSQNHIEGQFAVESARSQGVLSSSMTSQDTAAVRLPSGSLLPESQVLNQVVDRLLLNPRRETSSITLKLNPEELGQLKLDLVVEKDSVKAHLVAQTSQVQDVLERHIHRLREALEQQGLKLDQIKVDVDSHREREQGLFQQQDPSDSFLHRTVRRAQAPIEAIVAESNMAANGQIHSGLSLRV